MKILGIDIGATKTRIGIKDNSKIKIEEFFTQKDNFKDFLVEIISKYEFDKACIAIAGILDINKGKVILSPNLNLKNFNLKKFLEKEFDKEFIIVNDAIAACIGEKIYGKYKEKNFVYITISSGIGAGIIVNNRILLGKHGNAHEIGHMTIDFNSKIKCSCGKYGHWEAYCSGNSIPNFVKYYSKLKGYNIFDNIKKAEEFFKVYRKYSIGIEIFKIIQRINSIAIANVCNLFDPERIVIGGSVALNNKNIINIEEIKKLCIVKAPKINFSKVKHNGVLGSMYIAENNLNI
ncbi:MAG: ROK family protein [Candidatus Aenigmatarchaeota archaeon]